MKHMHCLLSLFALPLLATNQLSDYSAMIIHPEYAKYTLGETVVLKTKMEFSPQGYIKYQTPPEEQFSWWCKGTSGTYEEIHFLHSQVPSEPIRSMEKLPLSYNYGFSVPAFKTGMLTCRIQAKYLLQARDGSRAIFTIISNSISIEVHPPNPEDEIILKSLGIYENYMNGPPTSQTVEGVAIVNGAAVMFQYSKHPNSSYFCRPAVRDIRNNLNTYWGIESQDWASIPIVWNSVPKWFSEVKEKIDVVEKAKCSEISNSDVSYWRVLLNLLNGDFTAAQNAAKIGLNKEQNASRKTFYEKLLAFRNEDEFLGKFKSVQKKKAN